MSLLLDTFILIDDDMGFGDELAISAVSTAELHFGVFVAPDAESQGPWTPPTLS